MPSTEAQKRWYQENRERILEERRAEYEADPERKKAQVKRSQENGRTRRIGPDPEKSRERYRRYRQRNREAIAAADAARHEAMPDKARARNKVAQAIRRGQLARGSCEVCGKPDAQAHHDDYSKPLDVRWLCPRHHKALHMEEAA